VLHFALAWHLFTLPMAGSLALMVLLRSWLRSVLRGHGLECPSGQSEVGSIIGQLVNPAPAAFWPPCCSTINKFTEFIKCLVFHVSTYAGEFRQTLRTPGYWLHTRLISSSTSRCRLLLHASARQYSGKGCFFITKKWTRFSGCFIFNGLDYCAFSW